MEEITTINHQCETQRDRPQVLLAFCGVGLGISMWCTVVPHPVPTSFPRTITISVGFVWYWFVSPRVILGWTFNVAVPKNLCSKVKLNGLMFFQCTTGSIDHISKGARFMFDFETGVDSVARGAFSAYPNTSRQSRKMRRSKRLWDKLLVITNRTIRKFLGNSGSRSKTNDKVVAPNTWN